MAVDRGLHVDDFAPRLSFFFNLHNDFLEEIAKLRAARRIWAKVMKERFGAKNPKSLLLRTHAQTSGASLTAQQPFLNPRLLLDRNFAIGITIAFVMGMLSFTTLVLFPTLLHDLRGYPEMPWAR